METAAMFAKLMAQAPTDTRVHALAPLSWVVIKEIASVRTSYTQQNSITHCTCNLRETNKLSIMHVYMW